MSRHRDFSLDCKVYVGELGNGCAKEELEDKFSKYGPLKNVWVARKPSGFAFVEFEDARDAEDAVAALNGARLNGRRARVEMSNGRSRNAPGMASRGPPPRRYDDYRRSPPRRRRSDSRSPGRYRRSSPSYDRYRSNSRSRSRSRN